MFFSDIHMHALWGADDGASTQVEMYDMIDSAYRDGARYICFTPHYNPGYYGNNKQKSDKSFEMIKEYCAEKYPDLTLGLGNELFFDQNCTSWLTEGLCRCMNGTRYVLVDFHERASAKEIATGLEKILSSGFLPILAHAERYKSLNMSRIGEFKQNGVMIQANTQSLSGKFGFVSGRKFKKMMSLKWIDFISSDSHNITSRSPGIKSCYDYVARKCGDDYARRICFENAKNIIFNNA